MSTTLQKKIKLYLSKQQISVAELERRTGFKHAVMNILHGRSKNPTIRVAQAIAKELGCSVEELLSEKRTNNEASEPQWAQISMVQDKAFHALLYLETVRYVSQWLNEKNAYLTKSKALQCIEEIYEYALATPKQQIDVYFAQWYLNNHLSLQKKKAD